MIKVSNLRKNFGAIEALRGISFNVKEGEIYGLLGPNGAGKSTAISIISGLIPPSSGSISINNMDLSTNLLDIKKILGVVPQEVSLYKELSAYDNLMFFGSLYGLKGNELKRRVEETLELVGLSHRRKEPIQKFSGGMMRRLNLACGIIHKPKVLLLDEPTVGLDPQTRLNILEHILHTANLGTTILFSTHYLDEAEHICHRVGIIDHGEILAEGSLDDLRKILSEKQILSIKGKIDLDTFTHIIKSLNISDVEILSKDEENLNVALPTNEFYFPKLFKALSSLNEIKEITIKQPSLETLFIKLTGKELRE